MKLSLPLTVAGMLALVAACQTDSSPVDPVWGKQPCAHCHMLLSDPSSATQILEGRGQPLYFDDIGCAIEHVLNERGTLGQVWVRDESGAWQRGARARYASGHQTPMGYGIRVNADGPLDFAQVQREIALKRSARSER